jgi:dolichol-phosphate mannosyltransferase
VVAGPRSNWLIIPTYDEAENLEGIVAAAGRQLPASSRILIVDDNSPDGTGRIADRLASERDDLEVLHRPGKGGLGPAYLAGFKRALEGGAERILQMDADFSHDPVDLPRLIEASQDADVVLGSRYVPGGGVTEWGPMRRFMSRGGSAYARLMLGVRVHDLTGGFKCMRRQVLEAIDLELVTSRGYAFQIEMTYRAIRAGFRVVEIPITFHDRRVGDSKMSGPIFAEAVWRVPALRLKGGGGDDETRRYTFYSVRKPKTTAGERTK